MKGIIAYCVLIGAVITGSVFSQTVNICGTVRDENGTPLTKTMVRLGQTRFDNGYGMSPYYTTTDAFGRYHLGTGTCVVGVIPASTTAKFDAFSQPMYVGGKVVFSLPQDNSSVRMSLYDLAGRFVRDEMNGRFSKGNYSVSVDMRNVSAQYYLLRVVINGVATVLKARPASHSGAAGAVVQTTPESQTHLEKLAAVVDTLRATEPGYTLGVTPIGVLAGQYDFTLKKNNTWNGDINAFWDTAHVKKEAGHIWYTMLNRTGLPDSMVYYAIGDGGVPKRLSDGNTVDFTTNASGRLYIMVGYKPTQSAPGGYRPSNQAWDFEEHTNGMLNGSLWFHGNTTRVDAWGLPIAYRIKSTNGFDTTRGDLYHLFYQTRQSIFDEFVNEVPYEFTKLGTMQAPWKIPNPGVSGSDVAQGGKYATYSDKYAAKFGVGTHPYLDGIAEPKTSAAMHRHVMGMTDAQQANGANFYQATPCNFYSYFLHRRAIDSKCYGFPYDDYANWSSYIEHGNMAWVEIAIGY